jgi:hypothetical protein
LFTTCWSDSHFYFECWYLIDIWCLVCVMITMMILLLLVVSLGNHCTKWTSHNSGSCWCWCIDSVSESLQCEYCCCLCWCFCVCFLSCFWDDFNSENRDQGLTPTIPNDCPPFVRQLMEMCWKKDPDQRPVSSHSHFCYFSHNNFKIVSFSLFCLFLCFVSHIFQHLHWMIVS